MTWSAVAEKVTDWLGKQQSATVVLIGVLAALLYGMNVHLPSFVDRFEAQVQRERDLFHGECEAQRAHDEAQERRLIESFERAMDTADQRQRERTELIVKSFEAQHTLVLDRLTQKIDESREKEKP